MRGPRAPSTSPPSTARSSVATRLVGRLGPSFARRGRKRGTVIIGAAAADHHSLPLAILGDIVRGRGLDVVDLGANTPPASFLDTHAPTTMSSRSPSAWAPTTASKPRSRREASPRRAPRKPGFHRRSGHRRRTRGRARRRRVRRDRARCRGSLRRTRGRWSPMNPSEKDSMNDPAPMNERDVTGIIVVDHGSRRAESNDATRTSSPSGDHAADTPSSRPRHMEHAEPSIGGALDRCVAAERPPWWSSPTSSGRATTGTATSPPRGRSRRPTSRCDVPRDRSPRTAPVALDDRRRSHPLLRRGRRRRGTRVCALCRHRTVPAALNQRRDAPDRHPIDRSQSSPRPDGSDVGVYVEATR